MPIINEEFMVIFYDSVQLELGIFVNISPLSLRYWFDIHFVFPRNNWDVATVSIFGKLRESSL